MPILALNKRARFEYHILESFQAGLALPGNLVRQIRDGRVNLQSTFVIFQDNRLEIIDLGNDKIRVSVPLLLKQKEVDEIRGRLAEKGITCVVLNLKTAGRWLKAEVAVVRGKKNYDKRESIKNRELDRDLERQFKG
jgi:SsrA-binding protein